MTTTPNWSDSQNNRPTANGSGSAGLGIKRPGQCDRNIQTVARTGRVAREFTVGAVSANCAADCRASFTSYTVVSFCNGDCHRKSTVTQSSIDGYTFHRQRHVVALHDDLHWYGIVNGCEPRCRQTKGRRTIVGHCLRWICRRCLICGVICLTTTAARTPTTSGQKHGQ